jgi:hypothetical protein
MYTGGKQGRLPDGMPPDILLERWFARTYGWPPQTVRELPLETLTWFPVIEAAEAEAARIKANAEARTSRTRR